MLGSWHALINVLLLQHPESSSSERYWSHVLISIDVEKGHWWVPQNKADAERKFYNVTQNLFVKQTFNLSLTPCGI